MAKIKLKIKAGDQKRFTRGNPRQCSIATAVKREFGGSAVVGGSTAKIRGRYYVLGADARNVVADHDAGSRVGSRTITLYGKPVPAPGEQAGAQKARAARKQARAARKAKAAERAAAAEKARTQPAERPDPRQQARAQARERPRSAEEERTARVRARVQEAEGRERLRASATQDSRPAPARQERPVPQPRAAEHATRQARAIEPPRPALRFLRNPFAAREEAERQPEPAAARRNPR